MLFFYSKNANNFYTNNSLSYSFSFNRLNMWPNSTNIESAGDINNLPDYSWYKDSDLINISGNFTATTTSVDSHNLADDEVSLLPDLSNFVFQGRKQFSIGSSPINVYPINSSSTMISGHALSDGSVLIKYGDVKDIVETDSDGIFKYTLSDTISDNTEIEIVFCVSNSFIYKSRVITTPYDGELTIASAPNNVVFSLNPISTLPVILPKSDSTSLKIVDSRVNSTPWKLYAKVIKEMISNNGFKLTNAIVFKDFNDNVLTLGEDPTLVFTGNENNGSPEVYNLTWSVEKGLLLNLEDNPLFVNEEYTTSIVWNIEE